MDKNFVAQVSLSYQGQAYEASLYDDHTAVLDNGEEIKLTDDQYNHIMLQIYSASKQANKQCINDNKSEIEESDEDSADEEPRTFSVVRKGMRAAAVTLAYALAVGGTLTGAKYTIDHHLTQISVAQFANPVAKDEQIAAEDFQRMKMPESVYRKLSQAMPGKVLLWEDAQEMVGKYAAIDVLGQEVAVRDHFADSITENLWKADMTSEQKTFNLDFDYFTIDEIFPGSHINIKAVVNVKDGDKTKVANMTVNDAAALNFPNQKEAVLKTLPASALAIAPTSVTPATSSGSGLGIPLLPVDPNETVIPVPVNPGETVIPVPEQTVPPKPALPEQTAPSKPDVPESTIPLNPEPTKEELGEPDITKPVDQEDTGLELPDSGVDLFANVTVVDLKNDYNESLFDIYLRLSSMVPEERKAYLMERAASSNAKEYSTSLIPTVLVLAVDDVQYTDLTIVKNMENAVLEYAGIPSSHYNSTDEQNTMLMKFKEVQRDIHEIFSAARTDRSK